MAFVSLRQLLDHAAENDYGVPAFNINNMEQLLAIMAAADRTAAPVILQASRGARSYAGDIMLRRMVEAAVEMWPSIPVCLHLDHGDRPPTCVSAIQHGFTSVMMDGSLEADGKTPASYDYNVAVTAKVVEIAHAVGVSVEGELGCLGSLETGHGEKEDGHGAEGMLTRDQLLTDPGSGARLRRCAPASTPWRSPSAPAMAPTNSTANRQATSWRWMSSRRSTRGCRTRIW